MRGTRFGAAGRRSLTEDGHPRRGGSVERSSRWQAGGVAGNIGELVGEKLDVDGVLEEVAAGPDSGRVSLSTERRSQRRTAQRGKPATTARP
jgi:hypothetical protein